MKDPGSPIDAAERVERLVRELGSLADARTRAQAEELVRLLMDLYGSALAHMLEIVGRMDGGAAALFEQFAGDPLVSSLLILHGLHPLDVETRVERALEGVRRATGWDITLVAVSREAVKVRAAPAPGAGGRTAAPALQAAVERAIGEAAPELSSVEFETAVPSSPLLQIARTRPTEAGPLPADLGLKRSAGGS